MSKNEFDKNIWRDRDYWSQNYDGVSEPDGELEEGTRNAETVRDALLGKPEDQWNKGSHGWHNVDYTDDQHAAAWEHTDVDVPVYEDIYRAMLDMNERLKDGTYEP